MEAMKDAKELVVYKYYYTDVGEYSKDRNFKLFQSKISVPFTTDKTLYTYTGTISAGVDLAKLDEDNFKINDEKEKITITLPKPKILYHVIDDKKFQTYNVNNSVFTNSDLKDYKDFERKLRIWDKGIGLTNSLILAIRIKGDQKSFDIVRTNQRLHDRL